MFAVNLTNKIAFEKDLEEYLKVCFDMIGWNVEMLIIVIKKRI